MNAEALAIGSLVLGWEVVGPPLEGVPVRVPVQRAAAQESGGGALKGLLHVFDPSLGRSDATRRALERLREGQEVVHPELYPVDVEWRGEAAWVVVPTFERLDGPLPHGRVLDLVKPVVRALSAFHEQGRAHGQLDVWSVVVVDEQTRLLPPGLRLGPVELEHLGVEVDPRYASPEVLDGRAPTPASDVFSLGMVLFRLLSGRAPAAGTNPAEAFSARGSTLVPKLSLATTDQPREIEALYRLMCAEEGLRPENADALMEALLRVEREKMPPVADRPEPRLEPDRLTYALLALAVGLVILGVALSLATAMSPGDLLETYAFEGGEQN